MKKIIIIFAVLALGIVILLGGARYFMHEKTPLAPTPSSGPTPTLTTEQPVTTKSTPPCTAITIKNPKDNDKLGTTLIVKVIVDNTGQCHWTVFEAQAGTVVITDGLGKIIGKGILTTQEEWTKATPTTYTATITLSKASTSGGTLTITEENPSGKPNAQKYTIPVSF